MNELKKRDRECRQRQNIKKRRRKSEDPRERGRKGVREERRHTEKSK